MKTLVLGAGVIGVTSAYYLALAGHEVTVIDRHPGAALETSFANGGLVSPSHAEPWAGPDTPGQIIKWFCRQDAPFRFRLQSDPGFLSWCINFLGNCRTSRARIHGERMLRLSLYSRDCLSQLRDETGISYHAQQKGILHFYRNSKDLHKNQLRAEHMAELGCPFRALDRAEVTDLEPALNKVRDQIAGGLHYPEDESGDAYIFTQKLTDLCKTQGVKFMFGTTVGALVTRQGDVTGVETNKKMLSADAVVLALGSYSPRLTRPLGLKLPIQPVKGYSITLPVMPDQSAPEISLVDNERKLVFSRFGDRLRVAGMAETAGFDTSVDPTRAGSILKTTLDLFPDLDGTKDPEFWAGLRPMTPDNVPLIGRTKIKNLFVNSGHGVLGWTMSCGSGQIIADLVSGKEPGIDMDGLGVERFI
ncbi:MAG: D-amino acid dehydrogenase [Rhodospirillales bacterium]|nr:D-amino acid dehydrogenase [Rhodospirillales bacterium]